MTSDIEHRQIYTVATKPIRRFQLILGKFFGVLILDAVLVILFAVILYTVTSLMPRFFDASPAEIRQINNEFYTARASLVPPVPDVTEEVQALIKKLEDKTGWFRPDLSYIPKEK